MNFRPEDLTTIIDAMGEAEAKLRRTSRGRKMHPSREIEMIRLRLIRIDLMQERLRAIKRI